MATLTGIIAEACRLRLMRGLEEFLESGGYARIAGVDEAGRGALAGPVVAAAVIPSPSAWIPGVDDSKLLTAEERRCLAFTIQQTASAWAVAAVAADTIDRINILEASRVAMTRALAALTPSPGCAIVDAVALRGLPFPCLPVIRGDRISYAVACASILAKVERDRMMTALDQQFPHYGFAGHKGYGAPEHLHALAEYGPAPVHRLSFRSVLPRSAAIGTCARGAA
jgi:ribonuclease HII